MGTSSRWAPLGRIASGLSKVVREIGKRSSESGVLGREDLEALLVSTGKKALLCVTDLAGLTKGTVHEVSSRPRKGSSVVCFDDNGVDLKSNNVSETKSSGIVIDNGVAVGFSSNNEASQREKESIDEVVDCREEMNGVSNSKAEENAIGTMGATATTVAHRRKPRERRVPSTPFSRALGFAGLGAGLAWGTVQESAKRILYGPSDSSKGQSAISPYLSDKNAERLALALCRMRGAALKLGQMLSIQDESLVPAPILAALEIVRQGADMMPRSQLNQVLDSELGSNWSNKLRSFDYEPLAAASIGQVHVAVLKDGTKVAMKIQYPGVADSIESDIENVKLLLDYTNLIPKGLFLNNAMEVARKELSLECDYLLESSNQKRFRNLLSDTKGFYAPFAVDELSGKRVLTTEFVSGIPIDRVASMDQETRNYVGRKLLEITLLELFVFRFMQTDPNWSNFLYDDATKTINMIDFGAARDFPKSFVDDYLQMVMACANKDHDSVIEMSRRLGFITGTESDIMLDAHVQAGFVVGLPFAESGGYDFGVTRVAQNVSHLGATMLKHRLTPPPEEAYSLHRKLSGAFLACIKLRAVVPCREMLYHIYQKYQFGDSSSSSIEHLAGDRG